MNRNILMKSIMLSATENIIPHDKLVSLFETDMSRRCQFNVLNYEVA